MSEREPLDPKVYSRVFEHHAEGRQILDELERRFGFKAPVLTGGIDGIRRTDVNNGAALVIYFITTRINQANGVNDGRDE